MAQFSNIYFEYFTFYNATREKCCSPMSVCASTLFSISKILEKFFPFFSYFGFSCLSYEGSLKSFSLSPRHENDKVCLSTHNVEWAAEKGGKREKIEINANSKSRLKSGWAIKVPRSALRHRKLQSWTKILISLLFLFVSWIFIAHYLETAAVQTRKFHNLLRNSFSLSRCDTRATEAWAIIYTDTAPQHNELGFGVQKKGAREMQFEMRALRAFVH